MLVCFFKSHSDNDAECEIVKYVDRIWIDKSGNLTCIRTFIIYVKEGSKPLHEINMMIPFMRTPEMEDMTSTLLDQNYLFNGSEFSTGGYRIRKISHERDHGEINYDYFSASVSTYNLLKAVDSPKNTARIITIAFTKEAVQPGSYRAIRVKFRVTSVLDEMFSRVYSLRLNYFDDSAHKDDYSLLDLATCQIPVKTLYNRDTKQGGFDIFIYLPDSLTSSSFRNSEETTSRHLPNGTRATKRSQKFIWRGRKLFPDAQYLTVPDTSFTIEGLISDPFEMEEIRQKIVKLNKSSAWALWIGVVALLVSIVAMLWGSNISSFISGCFANADPGQPTQYRSRVETLPQTDTRSNPEPLQGDNFSGKNPKR